VEPEAAIYQRLAATAAITALVGPRIYPNEAAEDAARPFVVYQVVSTDTLRDLDGTVRFRNHAVNIWVEADSLDAAKPVGVAIFDALDRQTFAGVQRCYQTDYQSAEGDLETRAEVFQTFKVIQ
jgi:hypothetical protein